MRRPEGHARRLAARADARVPGRRCAPDCNAGMAARAQASAGGMTEADGRAAAARQNRAQAAAHAGYAAHRMPGLPDVYGLAGLMGQDGLQHQYPNEPEGRANPGSRQAVKDPGLAFCRVYTGWTRPIQYRCPHGLTLDHASRSAPKPAPLPRRRTTLAWTDEYNRPVGMQHATRQDTPLSGGECSRLH